MMIDSDGAISPANTIFVLLSFEGPDVYSTAGGLGTRVTELSEALAAQGYTTHLIFIGDPHKPSTETRVDGRLILKRWSQWISKYYLNGVYDGEEQNSMTITKAFPITSTTKLCARRRQRASWWWSWARTGRPPKP